MQTITLDFSDCNCWQDIQRIIKNAFNFPDYYGENLDALWDCACDFITSCYEKLEIIFKGINKLSSELQEYLLEIITVFNEIKESDPNITLKFA